MMVCSSLKCVHMNPFKNQLWFVWTYFKNARHTLTHSPRINEITEEAMIYCWLPSSVLGPFSIPKVTNQLTLGCIIPDVFLYGIICMYQKRNTAFWCVFEIQVYHTACLVLQLASFTPALFCMRVSTSPSPLTNIISHLLAQVYPYVFCHRIY